MSEDLIDVLESHVRDTRESGNRFGEIWEDRLQAVENSFEQYEKVLFAPDADKLFVMGQKMIETLGKKAMRESKDAIKDHKHLHVPVSRIGKTVDRQMTKRISELMKQEKDLEGDKKNQRLTERMIADYMVSSGLRSVAEELDKEANLNGVVNCRNFDKEEVNAIYEALVNGDPKPAYEWLGNNAEGESHLRGDLLKQIILEHLRNGEKEVAMTKMKELSHFGLNRQMQEVSRAFALGPNSPHCKSLFSEEVWPTLLARLSQVIYQADSSLDELVTTGSAACVKMLNIKKQLRKDHIFTSDELPIQVPPKKAVHNTFTCPILRQQTGDNNPPMRLLCGHVISKDALAKLSQSSRNFRVKCPYCPSEGTSHDAKVVQI